MFESLSKKLLKTFDAIRGKDKLSETDVKNALREIKIALLEADVSLPVVKDLLSKIEEKAIGQKVIDDVSPANQVVKIVKYFSFKSLALFLSHVSSYVPSPAKIFLYLAKIYTYFLLSS